MDNARREFQALVEAHGADLYRFAYWLCRERGRAEDLVQVRLAADYREPLLMHVLGGLSCREIAQAMNLSENTVMTRLFRARQKLRAALAVGDNPIKRKQQP